MAVHISIPIDAGASSKLTDINKGRDYLGDNCRQPSQSSCASSSFFLAQNQERIILNIFLVQKAFQILLTGIKSILAVSETSHLKIQMVL